jgi:hypothetical protein
MKKLLMILLTVCAFACGDRSNNSRDNEAGANTEQNASDNNNDETMQPDSTNTQQDSTANDRESGARH